tara:strand:- start:2480 stop:2587 length:108 start_codon:yes stop_codon:yes gene_type:complete
LHVTYQTVCEMIGEVLTNFLTKTLEDNENGAKLYE